MAKIKLRRLEIAIVAFAAAIVHQAAHTCCTVTHVPIEYRYSTQLGDGFQLHWSTDLEQQTIAFAVNVSTTGWIGFGISPDSGLVSQSDIAVGWVDNNRNVQFYVSLMH